VRLRSVAMVLAASVSVLTAGCSASGGTGSPATVIHTRTVTAAPQSDPLLGYKQRAVDVARRLKTCTRTKVLARSTARCVNVDGDFVGITTTDDADEQDYLVAQIKDGDPTTCTVVLKGVVIGASNESALTEVVGVPEQFASDHRGYLLCPGA
jgi:hypothetical protein